MKVEVEVQLNPEIACKLGLSPKDNDVRWFYIASIQSFYDTGHSSMMVAFLLALVSIAVFSSKKDLYSSTITNRRKLPLLLQGGRQSMKNIVVRSRATDCGGVWNNIRTAVLDVIPLITKRI